MIMIKLINFESSVLSSWCITLVRKLKDVTSSQETQNNKHVWTQKNFSILIIYQ